MDDHSVWDRDQLDPDNWLRIPEFGVAPRDVWFKGFAFPIVTPLTQEEPFANSLREMARSVRRLARSEFQTLSELRTTALYAMDVLWPASDAADHPRGNEVARLTKRQVAALRYTFAMQSFEAADKQWFQGRKEPANEWSVATSHRSAESIANGAAMVIGWLTDKPFERDLKALQGMRQGASIGGKASGETRRAQSGVPPSLVLRGQRDKLISDGRDPRNVAAILGARYGCTPDHIRKEMKRD